MYIALGTRIYIYYSSLGAKGARNTDKDFQNKVVGGWEQKKSGGGPARPGAAGVARDRREKFAGLGVGPRYLLHTLNLKA